MSHQDPHTTDESVAGGDDLLREMYERVRSLEERVATLEADNADLASTNTDLASTVDTLKQQNDKLSERNKALHERTETLEEQVETLTGQMNAAGARADVLYEEIEQAQADITDQAFHSEERLAEVTKRVAGIEQELGLEDWETASALAPNACALERFASMPADRRSEELKAPVSRATVVWEHFDEWSSPTHKGRVIRSGELRKLLKAKTGKKLAWTQVYRIMEEFEENTTAQYRYIGSDDDTVDSKFGKALIRLRNFDSDGARAMTDGGQSDW
jgi:cell division protein FtsB